MKSNLSVLALILVTFGSSTLGCSYKGSKRQRAGSQTKKVETSDCSQSQNSCVVTLKDEKTGRTEQKVVFEESDPVIFLEAKLLAEHNLRIALDADGAEVRRGSTLHFKFLKSISAANLELISGADLYGHKISTIVYAPSRQEKSKEVQNRLKINANGDATLVLSGANGKQGINEYLNSDNYRLEVSGATNINYVRQCFREYDSERNFVDLIENIPTEKLPIPFIEQLRRVSPTSIASIEAEVGKLDKFTVVIPSNETSPIELVVVFSKSESLPRLQLRFARDASAEDIQQALTEELPGAKIELRAKQPIAPKYSPRIGVHRGLKESQIPPEALN